MDIIYHSGFQTIEFGLLLLLTGWILQGRDLDWKLLAVCCLLGVGGLFGIRVWGDDLPTLPFFVSFWRIASTLIGAVLVREYLVEWWQHRQSLSAHLFGLGFALAGAVVSWWANWEVWSGTFLLLSFVGLGYCARRNRL